MNKRSSTCSPKSQVTFNWGVTVSLLFITVIAGGMGSAADPGNENGHFVVADAYQQFGALKHHGEALGWTNPEHLGAVDPSSSDHYQGLARYPGTGIPVFYVTQKDDDDAVLPGASEKGGYLHVVRFGTRAMSGERLRSNLQKKGWDTEEVQPPPEDTWVRSIRFDGSIVIDGSPLPAYVHPGSMAIIDDILFVPLDTPRSGGPAGQIVLFDLAGAGGREIPVAIQAIALTHSIDNLAVTRRNNGKYLLWVNGDGGNVTKFYVTNGTDLRADSLDLIKIQDWDSDSGADYNGFGASWPGGTGAHQSATFVRNSDGSLYLIGMRHPGGMPWSGSDYADLYRVDPKAGDGFKLTRYMTRHLYCVYDRAGRICNFAAADNAYVSPSGELILYSIPHDDEDGPTIDFTRLGEFRHRDVNRPGSPLRLPSADSGGPYSVGEFATVSLSGSGAPSADRPWAELYDDDHFSDRSIVVDYDDRSLLELNNFNYLDNFNDKPTSIRWRFPVGMDAELFDDDNFSDRKIIIRGTGSTEEIADLDGQTVQVGVVEHPGKDPGETLDFNGKTSSMRFIGSSPSASATLTWDLDGDGYFGETGMFAARGNETGGTPVFSAAGLDGPTQFTITVRATSAGTSVLDTAIVSIENVAPTADAGNDASVNEGATISLSGYGSSDPAGAADPLAYQWDLDYNGGVFSVEAVGPTPLFAGIDGPALFTCALRVTDDDGATSGIDTTVISVANVAPSVNIDSVNGGIEGTALITVPVWLDGSFGDVPADTHTAFIDWDDGSQVPGAISAADDTVEASHVYMITGTFSIELAVTDDDGGVGISVAPLTVHDGSGAVESVIEEIDDALSTVTDPMAEKAMKSARQELAGNNDENAANGAVDKLEGGDPVAALVKIIKAIEDLEDAEAANGSDFQSEKLLLGLAAQSVAQVASLEAIAAVGPSPSAEQQEKLNQIADFIAGGIVQMGVPDYVASAEAFKSATARAVELIEG
jgi:hypothetical protein